jgi:hypothetical protein
MREDNIGGKNLRAKMPDEVESLDEQLREYKRLLDAHHHYTRKIRGVSSRGIDTLDEKQKERLTELDTKKNLLHRELIKHAKKIGKTSADVVVDLLLLDGGMKEYGLDLPMLTFENSPDIVKKEKLREMWIPELVFQSLQDNQPINHNEVALIIGTETSDQFDADSKPVSTYAIHTQGQEPVVDSFTFSSGFTERMVGIKKLIADHPDLVRAFATGAFMFHGSTRSYGIIMKKGDLIDVAGILRDNREKYLPETKSASIKVDLPIGYGGASATESRSKFSEIMSLIPDEMLCDDDLTRRLGQDGANEYLKKRWGK